MTLKHDNKARGFDMPERIETLFGLQLREWPLFSENYDHCAETLKEEVELTADMVPCSWRIHKMLLNHRKNSLAANIDSKAIAVRKCFLCADNRPEEQDSIRWRDYEILVNPYPIADNHLTIAHTEHTPQRIIGHIRDMAALTRIVPTSCVFYNGPKCGASAPDHMHFQSFAESFSTNIWMSPALLTEIAQTGAAHLYIPTEDNSIFPYFIIDSGKDKDLEAMFNKVYAALPPSEPEPMMNIVMFKNGSKTRTLIVPRKAHRPSFYGDGEGQMLVSPASVEMLGTFVTSRKDDFERLDIPTVERIYREVCLSEEEFENIVEKINEQTTVH